MAYSDIARCAACGALLADAPDVSRTHVIAYTVFGVAVAALLLFAAYFYR